MEQWWSGERKEYYMSWSSFSWFKPKGVKFFIQIDRSIDRYHTKNSEYKDSKYKGQKT